MASRVELVNEANEAAVAVAAEEGVKVSAKGGFVTIGDVQVPVRTDVSKDHEYLIPPVDTNYFFASYSSDIAEDLNYGKKVLLTGHTGTGKTSLFQQIAARIGQPVLRSNLNGQTTVGDFVGLWTVKGGSTEWIDGALPMAMRHGWWLILDELDFADAPILSVLNSVLEPRGALMLKEKGHEVIKPHPNFRLLATANTVGCMQRYRSLYQGTNILNEAFLDRWRVYHVDYLPAKNEADVIAGFIVSLKPKRSLSEEDLKARPTRAMHVAAVIVKCMNMAREAFEKEEISCTFSLRRGLDWAEMLTRHAHPAKAAEATIFSKISREDADIIKGIITRVTKLPASGDAVKKE